MAAVLLLTMAMLACDYLPDKKRVTDEAAELTKAAAGTIMDNSDAPIEEVKKLRQFEYRVFRLPLNSEPSHIESQLNALGKERWNCYHVERVKGEQDFELEFFCKRMPATPLMYMPKGFIGN
ncbi:MAG: hypothetical protein KDD66_13045 [Bdellovibrionales bacterium]|nr:hypothetical protein [Bdellovibrionales bacterium]